MVEGDDVKQNQQQACFGTFQEFSESTASTPLLSCPSTIMVDNYDNEEQQREEKAPLCTFGRTLFRGALKPSKRSNHVHGKLI